MSRKKIGGIETFDLLQLGVIGGGLYLVYTIGKSITDKLGLSKSDAQVAYEASATNPLSPWAPAFYNGRKQGDTIFTASAANDIAQKIYDTYDDFYIAFGNDFNGLKAQFNRITSQIMLSQVAGAYYALFNSSLLDDLKSRHMDSNVQLILNYVKALRVH